MRTQAKDKMEIVKNLAEVIEMRKALEKKEKELKETVKLFMGTELMLEAGDFVVNIKSRSRTDLNKDALKHDLGDKYKQYEMTSTYDIMEINLIRKAA